MKLDRAAITAKSVRKELELTQQQLTFDGYFGSRESISAQENGRYQVQPELAKYYTEKHNNPWVAMEAAAEYVGWGPVRLDGEAADLHRTTVTMKTKEELQEALESMNEAANKLTVNPSVAEQIDIKVIEKSLLECIDAITALNHYVAVLSKEYGISWVKLWGTHKLKLIQRKFIKNK